MPSQAASVADELAVLRTLAAYCHHCDDGQLAELVALFTPDACFVRGAIQVTGHAALREYFAERQGLPEQRGRHLTVNSVVDLSGGTARALSDFVYLKYVDGRLAPFLAGRYRDDFVRSDDGRWRFTRREVEDWTPAEGGETR